MIVRIAAVLMASLVVMAQAPVPDLTETPRGRALTREIACMVCDGQSIGDSNAPVAADMRRRVAELMADGLSDQEIRDYMAERYGEAVLLRPSADGAGMLLWFAPIIVFLGAITIAIAVLGRRNPQPPEDVDA